MLTGKQVREARALLKWSTARLARNARIGFVEAFRASDDEGVQTLNGLQLRAIRDAFDRSGVEIRPDGAVRLRPRL